MPSLRGDTVVLAADEARAGVGTAAEGSAAEGSADDGTAVLEVLALGVGLLVPMLYAVVSVMTLQAASFAATSAARESARTYVTASTPAQGSTRARAVTRLVLADAGFSAAAPVVRCIGGCLVPGSRVDVSVGIEVGLPLLPGGPSVTVTGRDSMPVDRYRSAP